MGCEIEAVSIGWFVAIWVGVLVAAIFSKSLICNLGLIFASVLGYSIALGLTGEGIDDGIRYGLAVVFLCVVGFSIMQILTRVERI